MTDSAILKIDRAAKHILDLSKQIEEQRPFSYILETNAKTGERATLAKQNPSAIASAACIIGDCTHNLRSALDHAYWAIVYPVASTDKERRAIQFPFSETAPRLEEAVKNRLAHRVSDAFFNAVMGIKPHGEDGGNRLLWLVHEADLIDKHRLLTPVGDYTRIDLAMIHRQIPDCPFRGDLTAGMNRRDIGWRINPKELLGQNLGTLRAPTTFTFEKELDVPVSVVLAVRPQPTLKPLIPILNEMVAATKAAVAEMRNAIR